MNLDQRISQALQRLVDQGKEVAATIQHAESRGDIVAIGFGPWVDAALYSAWVTSVLNLVGRVFGRDSDHYQHLLKYRENPSGLEHMVAPVQGIVSAAKSDYDNGYLFDVKELAAAEVFGDILEMAAYLQKSGYHVAAASLSGGVLEDSLRRLHLKHIGKWAGDSNISKLNDGLHKQGVYAQPQWRQIQTWGDIRNDADHGNFASINAADVGRMIDGITDFVVRYAA